MLKIIIIEDEKPACEWLIDSLMEIDPEIKVSAVLTSVKEGKIFMSGEPSADIIFSDIQLTDGFSFEIFKKYPPMIPVIFITGFDEYMTNALEYNGIDYLLKPVEKYDLQKAIKKFHTLRQHFSGRLEQLQHFINSLEQKKKDRLLVRKGIEFIALRVEEIVLLYTENKLVYIIDREGRKYIADKSLSEMEEELDTRYFFRANRQYIVNIHYIRGFRPYEKVKLQLELSLTEIKHAIIISQETAPSFRKWIV